MVCAGNQTSVKAHCRGSRPKAAKVVKPKRLTKKGLREMKRGFMSTVAR